MQNNNNEVIIRKIDLKVLIDTLVDVYNSGANYVDLVGKPDEEQDTIGIIVHENYMADPDEMIEEEEEEDKPLSDDDINQLL